MTTKRPLGLYAGACALAAMLFWLRGAMAPEPAPPRMPRAAPAPPAAPTSPALPIARPPAPVAAAPIELPGGDTSDPCGFAREPAVPPDFQTVTTEGITVAWAQDTIEGTAARPLRPVMLAHLVAGLIDEAAQLTGTPPRAELTVILHPTRAALLQRLHAPAWVDGAFDGAVELAASGFDDLGVSLRTLRHEVLHAQLHAAGVCMPLWFDEGLASYFSDDLPAKALFDQLSQGGIDPARLRALHLFALPSAEVDRIYLQSLAMVLYLIDRDGVGEPAIRTAVRELPQATLTLWDRVAPGVSSEAVLDAFAQRTFGQARGTALDAILAGPLCCVGTSNFSALRCHAGQPPPEIGTRRFWFEPGTHATCRRRW